MAITESMDSPSSPSPTASNFSGGQQQRHFYLAVDRLQFKMQEMLVDLLGVAGRRSGIPMAVCCSSRDELDAVCSAVSNLPDISLASLYSDLAESERTLVLETFRQATIKWAESAMTSVQFGDDGENQNNENKSQMIVVTDACLPGVLSGESSIAARILINYELPTKKEMYMRRVSTCLAADGIVINVVAGGEVVTLKNVEESCGLLIAEMPINIAHEATSAANAEEEDPPTDVVESFSQLAEMGILPTDEELVEAACKSAERSPDVIITHERNMIDEETDRLYSYTPEEWLATLKTPEFERSKKNPYASSSLYYLSKDVSTKLDPVARRMVEFVFSNPEGKGLVVHTPSVKLARLHLLTLKRLEWVNLQVVEAYGNFLNDKALAGDKNRVIFPFTFGV
ncbi:unnamed protein product [Linum tenue]|uniref:Uncharacterized protein n=1 Tax=Linum tenue TaxID=586396 RepID=A0AAV0QSJ9_9ROSI|nr:unnamed protein product [Linum tenue]